MRRQLFSSVVRRYSTTKAASIEEQYNSTGSNAEGTTTTSKTSIQFSIELHRAGSLVDALTVMQKNGVNLSHISTRQVSEDNLTRYVTCFADLVGRREDENIQRALAELETKTIFTNVVGSWTVPWYPTKIAELDKVNQRVLAAGADLQDDPQNPHPGFHDQLYRARRREICNLAFEYKHGQPIPSLQYTKDEIATWGAIWDRLTKLFPKYACKEFNYILPLLVENCGYSRNSIPQLKDVSAYLESRTGFTLRPVGGLLSSRDFLAGLAFRVFHSTQYIRHHSKPFYTPEPDVVHELMGHTPLYADPDFADFSQTLGMASLGASDEDVKRLATCYWFTVEFGLCKQHGALKAYGAGILSSFGELEHALSGIPKTEPFDPFVAGITPYPITTFQPLYFVANSFKEMKKSMEEYAKSIDRPFTVKYNPYCKSMMVFSRNTEEYLKA